MRSDTLASALVETAFRAVPQFAPQVLADFSNGIEPRSSLFFCLQINAGQTIYFLPKPASLDTADPGPGKERKEIFTAFSSNT